MKICTKHCHLCYIYWTKRTLNGSAVTEFLVPTYWVLVRPSIFVIFIFFTSNTFVYKNNHRSETSVFIIYLYNYYSLKIWKWLPVGVPKYGTNGKKRENQSCTWTKSVFFALIKYLFYYLSPRYQFSILCHHKRIAYLSRVCFGHLHTKTYSWCCVFCLQFEDF